MKRNVTIAVDEEIYRTTRTWAAAHNTSISAIVEYCILHLPRISFARQAVEMTRAQREGSKSRGMAAFQRALDYYRERDRRLREENK